MSSIVEILGMNKSYGMSKKVFTDLHLKLESGRIIGLLGPNGSGKTTLIKVLAGLLKPESGDVLIDGMHIGEKTKACVSYLPERTYFNEYLTVHNLVSMFQSFYADFDSERAYRMMELLGINPNMTLKKLSKGNKEKVQLIMVMSRRAKLYLLDEPIAGVDPAARDYILNTIITNYDSEATILLSTHLISDIENILDEVIFVKDGTVICQQNADEMRASKGQSVDEIFREVFRC